MKKLSFKVAALAGLFILNTTVFAADLEESCKKRINQALPVWTMSSVSEDVKEFVAAELQADPLKVKGDFDGDGRQDVALLIQNKAQALLKEPDRIKATKIAVCLAKAPSMVLRFIEEPYCDDFIYLMEKGEDMFDFEAGKLGTYSTDAIGTACFERAGAVFVLDGDSFKRIINSD